MINNINSNLTKIYYYKLYINTKIMYNLSLNVILKIIIEFDKVNIDFWIFFLIFF